MQASKWYIINETSDVISPSLLVYPDRIKKNIERMIEIAGGPGILRPHIKTHKMAEIVQMQMDMGIYKFKCATIAEAELLAQCGAQDILLAMQMVGANMYRFFRLISTYQKSKFSTLVDNLKTLDALSALAKSKSTIIQLWMDIDNGMKRTGIPVGRNAEDLYKKMVANSYIHARGFHTYDGHIHNNDIDERQITCDAAIEPVLALKQKLEKEDLGPIEMVVGGTPSFPIHCKRPNIEVSPGTTLLWDEGYGTLFPEMDFSHAACLMTRIISKPGKNRLCFDLGHKSIAPEMEFPRMRILGLENAQQIGQSEEHLVVECENADAQEVGDVFYAIPMHICPTVAKYESVETVEDHKITGTWKVAARNHKIKI
jgi:D-serine deaminase-like pyridoxal phosphate-dependent protein